jgi:excisionase family DNA binding protein
MAPQDKQDKRKATTAVTIREAARLLDCSERWVRIAVKNGSLRSYQDPADATHTYMIKLEDLKAWSERDKQPRGGAAGPKGRWRFVCSIPATSEHKEALLKALRNVSDLIVRQGDDIVLDTQEKGGNDKNDLESME